MPKFKLQHDEEIIRQLDEIFVNFEVIYTDFMKKKDKLDLYGKTPITIILSEPVEEMIHYICANLKNELGMECTKSSLIEKMALYILSDPKILSNFITTMYETAR
ncbi:MAG: hypothetical protein ACTSYD_08855 [Candidatus Heimdallarchaeaceae archaeon]